VSEQEDRPDTKLVTGGRRREWTGGIVNPPVWRASTILFDSVEHMRAAYPPEDGRLHYGRNGTPSQWSLAEALTELEPGAAGTRLFPSGVAAISVALMTVLSPGRRAFDGRQHLRADQVLLRRASSRSSASPPVITTR
jgi:cystathionine beta-lyase